MIDVNYALTELKDKGFVILKQAANMEVLNKLRDEFEEAVKARKFSMATERFLFIKEPFLTCPSTVKLILEEPLLQIVEGYLGKVRFGHPNLRKSLLNNLPPGETNLFHSDKNNGAGVSILKMFFYLHDVDEEAGPFEYILGSHKEKWTGWEEPYRKTDEEIYRRYPGRSVHAIANYGDIVMADTTGFHRGFKCKSKTRSMYTPLFVTSRDGGGPLHIFKRDLPKLEYAEFLQVL